MNPSYEVIDAIGLVATFMSFIIMAPQAWTTWKHRNDAKALAGVSLGTPIIVLISALLWIAYGYFIGAVWVAVHESLGVPISLFIIYLVLKSRKASKCQGAGDEDE